MIRITDENDWYWKDPQRRMNGAPADFDKRKPIECARLEIHPKDTCTAEPKKVERKDIDFVMQNISNDKMCYRLSHSKDRFYIRDADGNRCNWENGFYYITNCVFVNLNYGATQDDVDFIIQAIQTMLDQLYPEWRVTKNNYYYKSLYDPEIPKNCLMHDLNKIAIVPNDLIQYAKDNKIVVGKVKKIEWDAFANDVKYTLYEGDVVFFKNNPLVGCPKKYEYKGPKVTN